MSRRTSAAAGLRRELADELLRTPDPTHNNNGEDGEYPLVASYTKGLPHDEVGEAEPRAYARLLRALSTHRRDDFESVPLGPAGERPLVNPQAGLAFDPQGPDAQALTIPPAPRIDGRENSAEMVELYWMALLRDVPFGEFSPDTVGEAAEELTGLDFRGPRVDGEVTPGTLFRGDTPGDLRGPYVSQFLLRDIPYGTLRVPQLHATAPPGEDHLTSFADWLAVQNAKEFPPEDPSEFPTRGYPRTPRDLATYVHFDALYQAYLNAALILLGLDAPTDPNNPYNFSDNQEGFGTYGGPHLLSLVTEVATRALKTVWYQKWFVHRRLRPEEFGGRIHAHLTEMRDYPMIDGDVLDSTALRYVAEEHGGCYLLPQAYREGSPNHPAYGAGHSTVAAACVTVLKAFFDTSFVITDPVVPDEEGRKLVPYEGEVGVLTLEDELNKLAANISIARNMAGVHWRTDYTESLRLGERIGIGVVRDQLRSAHEDGCLSLTRFDGTRITITP
ncbi:vanadium-dependent haloperoxidase [Halostreptopolyspora alba]|uniref:Phosphoesterase n=1 Tax=Halostreptopolyspora alba TaxID=2487137 RepID=A0A3N0ED16_9ACTN|nr:phosphoesterase [Nocardiopsaceae bacterium YIM 96095]